MGLLFPPSPLPSNSQIFHKWCNFVEFEKHFHIFTNNIIIWVVPVPLELNSSFMVRFLLYLKQNIFIGLPIIIFDQNAVMGVPLLLPTPFKKSKSSFMVRFCLYLKHDIYHMFIIND